MHRKMIYFDFSASFARLIKLIVIMQRKCCTLTWVMCMFRKLLSLKVETKAMAKGPWYK
jgi:hypothetical protein